MFNDIKRILMKAHGERMTTPPGPEVPEPFLSFIGMTVPREGDKVTECQIIQDIKSLAETLNLKLRIWTPDSFGTMDYNLNRLNIRLINSEDNKSFVISDFNRG
jgi:hypothetical protein